MNALRRAARVVAKEGLGGLLRRIAKKTLRPGEQPQTDFSNFPNEPNPSQVPDPTTAAGQRQYEIHRAAERLIAETHKYEERKLAWLRQQAEQRAAEGLQEYERQLAAEKIVYEEQAAAFNQRTGELGCKGLEEYYWYHTVDLGNGLVTPGDYDFRGQLPAFHFPANMAGMKVMDVGSATGFFAYEFEKRGADVTSVELPSLEDWDILSCDRDSLRQKLMAFFKASTPEEAYKKHLDGPFQFCHTALNSRVKRCFSPIYDLGQTKIGKTKFDFIYAGDILLHLFSPLKALDVLSELCQGSLMVTIDVPFPGGQENLPMMAYMGGFNRETDSRTWWTLSPVCVEQILKRMGFETVQVVGNYSGIIRRNWIPYSRAVILATRSKSGQLT